MNNSNSSSDIFPDPDISIDYDKQEKIQNPAVHSLSFSGKRFLHQILQNDPEIPVFRQVDLN